MHLAETVVQALGARPQTHTAFSIVRFEEVFDGPGTLMESLAQAIEAGGPVRLSHPQATTHVLSRAEAAALVIQAGALARGGEVLVLDMGEQVRVEEVARSMIVLMGLKVRDHRHPFGDIAFEYDGLGSDQGLNDKQQRVRERCIPTEHPAITLLADEAQPVPEAVERILEALHAAMHNRDEHGVRAILRAVV
jgi:FlaA1/EpsC-like NDP-sugar epimerase